MIVAQSEPAGGAGGDGAEVLGHALADRLQRLEAVGRAGGMDADDLAAAVVDRHEDVGAALLGRTVWVMSFPTSSTHR